MENVKTGSFPQPLQFVNKVIIHFIADFTIFSINCGDIKRAESMGAAGSTIKLEHLSANDIGRLVAGLGEKYISYEVLIVENGISGEVLTSLNGGEMKEILVSIGVSNVAHQTILITHFKRLKGEASGAGGGGGGVGNNSGGEAAVNPGGCVFHALPSGFSVGEQVTKSPRAIMSKLFEIQGIAVDPSDLDPAIEKIAKAVGGGFGDGVNKYDCFINYRVAADADLAEKLYLYLKTKGIHAFLDKKCLKNGEKWKDGFLAGKHLRDSFWLTSFCVLCNLTGLKNSKCFVALISKKALDRVRDKECDHTWDNVLLEYETALNVSSSITCLSSYRLSSILFRSCKSQKIQSTFVHYISVNAMVEYCQNFKTSILHYILIP